MKAPNDALQEKEKGDGEVLDSCTSIIIRGQDHEEEDNGYVNKTTNSNKNPSSPPVVSRDQVPNDASEGTPSVNPAAHSCVIDKVRSSTTPILNATRRAGAARKKKEILGNEKQAPCLEASAVVPPDTVNATDTSSLSPPGAVPVQGIAQSSENSGVQNDDSVQVGLGTEDDHFDQPLPSLILTARLVPDDALVEEDVERRIQEGVESRLREQRELYHPPRPTAAVLAEELVSSGLPIHKVVASTGTMLCGLRRTTFWWLVVLSLLVVIVFCATLIPYTLRMYDVSEAGSTSPGPNSYGCYTSLADILHAQVSDENHDDPTYVICPNTKIKVGMINPAADDYRYIDGDYPIIVTRENVTIQCGWDGRRDNNCVIDAGFMHVLTGQLIAMPDGTLQNVTNRTNDNLLIRGITFTGIPINVGPFRGNSVSLSHPGKNMRFEDCVWYNMTAQNGLIGVYRNYYQVLVDLPFDDLSIEVTFADCVFENIVFEYPLIFARNQAIKLERCIFRNIQLSSLIEAYCRYFSGVDGEVVESNQGCATLLACAPQSNCSMKDVCVHGIEIVGQGIVVIHDEATFKHEGLYLEPNSTKATCEMAILSTLDGAYFTCSKIFDEPSCPLLP